MYRTCLVTLGLLIGFSPAGNSFADSRTPGKVIAGYVEKITVLPADIVVSAKLDSGAKTSSINAQKIERFQKDGERWVRFELVLEDEDDKIHRLPMERPISRRVAIKRKDQDHDRRVVVELDFCFDGRLQRAEFSLNNRSKFIYPILLGREFLAGTALIDPDLAFLTQARCSSEIDA